MRAGVKMKCRSINEDDGDETINAGFDQVAFVNGIANSGLSDDVCARDGDRTHHLLYFADGKGAYKWCVQTLSARGRAAWKNHTVGQGHMCPLAPQLRGPTSHSTLSATLPLERGRLATQPLPTLRAMTLCRDLLFGSPVANALAACDISPASARSL